MLRVKTISPLKLEPEEVVRRQARYDALAAPDLEVTLFNLEGDDAPLRFDHPEEIEASEALTYREMRNTDPAEFDVLLPDCVLDPGLDKLPAPAVPAQGILRLASGFIHAMGSSFAAITRNAAIGEELSRKVGSYGLGTALSSVEILDVDFCFVSDHSQWELAMGPVVKRLASQGVKVLLNGCSAVDISQRRLEGVLVVDPTELALRALSVGYRIGAFSSGAGVPAYRSDGLA